jgi:hypothetical protein
LSNGVTCVKKNSYSKSRVTEIRGLLCIYKLLTLILIRESLTEINSKIRENKKIPTRDENQNPKLNQQY